MPDGDGAAEAPVAEETPKTAEQPEAEAAQTEVTEESKSVEFRGVELSLPAKIPGALAFDLAALEDENTPSALIRVLKGLLGDEQTKLVRSKIVDDEVSMEEIVVVMAELLDTIIDQYGTGTGE